MRIIREGGKVKHKTLGNIYELTGPQSLDMHALAAENESELDRPVQYTDAPVEQWQAEQRARRLLEHVTHQLLTMADLPAANRCDRLTHDVEKFTGKPATSVRDSVVRADRSGLQRNCTMRRSM